MIGLMKRWMVAGGFALSLCVVSGIALGQQPQDQDPPAGETPGGPTTQPVLVDVTDKAAVDAAMDKDVELEGTVLSAEWSASGKVMLIKFEKADESKVMAALFQEKREAFDAAFNGDVGKTLTGARVRIKGRLKDFKGKPEVVISRPSQITIVEGN